MTYTYFEATLSQHRSGRAWFELDVLGGDGQPTLDIWNISWVRLSTIEGGFITNLDQVLQYMIPEYKAFMVKLHPHPLT